MNWSFLELLPGLTAVSAVWRRHLGDNFEAFKLLCLQPASRPALSYPCALPTSCSYRIEPAVCVHHPPPLTPQLFTRLCKRDPPRCPPIQVTLADITPLELNWTKLSRAIS